MSGILDADPPVDRRRFLHLCGGCLGALATLPGCATARTYQAAGAQAGRVRIPAADLPAAFGEDHVLLVQAEGLPESVYLVRDADGAVRDAVGSTCTHLGCPVRPANQFFRCPCHGSTYTLDGAVVRGPAPKPLSRYTLTVTEDFLEIELP